MSSITTLPRIPSSENLKKQLSTVRLIDGGGKVDSKRFSTIRPSGIFSLWFEVFDKSSQKHYFILIPLAIIGALVAIGISLLNVASDSYRASLITQTNDIAIQTSSQFEVTVTKAFQPAIAFGSVVDQERNCSKILPNFITISQRLMASSNGAVNNVGIAPNCVNVAKYPLVGNEKAIGHDLLAARYYIYT